MLSPVSDKPINGGDINIGTQNENNKVNTGEGVVRTDVLNLTTQTDLKSDFHPINRTITENEQPLVHLKMNEALEVLNAIENACDEGKKTQLGLDRKTSYVGTVKNLFYKFLGLFSKSLEAGKRTQALNAKWHLVATRLKDDKNLYNGVLLSTLNDPKLDASLKTTCFKLYDNDPNVQDKLFKSLKEPPKEIREQFWERNKEKILNGEFFGFQLKDTNAEAIKNEFMSVEKEPLQSLLTKNISAEKCKNLNEYRGIFEKSNLPKTFTQNGHVETFLMSYFSVTEEHAKTLLQEDLEAGKVGDLDEQHRQNADKIFGILSKSNSITFGDNGILLFRELFQDGDGKRFTFTVNGQTVCDIDQSKLKELAKQKEPAERRHLAEILKLANNDLKQAQEKYNNAPEGSEEKNVAWGAVEKAEKKLQQAELNVKNYKPTVTLKDFFDEIKTQIKGKNIEKASIEKLALFLASGISLMPPTDQAGRGICNMNRCHCSCVVSKDGTLIINQKFDKVKSAQKGELYTRFRNILDQNATFKSVAGKCYTETSMEIEHTFKAVGSRNREKSELKSFDHAVKFSK